MKIEEAFARYLAKASSIFIFCSPISQQEQDQSSLSKADPTC